MIGFIIYFILLLIVVYIMDAFVNYYNYVKYSIERGDWGWFIMFLFGCVFGYWLLYY